MFSPDTVTAADLLERPLADLSARHLRIVCSTCGGKIVHMDCQRLAKHRPGLLLIDAVNWLRCQRCRSRPSDVQAEFGAPMTGGRQPYKCVPLVGVGTS
jgi:hypothetical protein